MASSQKSVGEWGRNGGIILYIPPRLDRRSRVYAPFLAACSPPFSTHLSHATTVHLPFRPPPLHACPSSDMQLACQTAAGPASRSCRPAVLRVWVERGARIRDAPDGERNLEIDTELATNAKCARDHDDGRLESGRERELLVVVSGPCETASPGADARARAALCPFARPRRHVTLCAPARIALAPTHAAALREVHPRTL